MHGLLIVYVQWFICLMSYFCSYIQVLVLKELALNAPTFFFQQVQPFFENIPNAVRDPKVSLYCLKFSAL